MTRRNDLQNNACLTRISLCEKKNFSKRYQFYYCCLYAIHLACLPSQFVDIYRFTNIMWSKAKSRKYQAVFKVKSRVKTWQVRGIWSQQLEHKQVPKRGTEPGVRKGKRSLLASHTRCKCSMETTHNSVKIKLGIKVMKWWKVLIGWEVTVGQGSECHLTFVRGSLHIAE